MSQEASKPTSEDKKRSMEASVLIAIITGLVTIIVALLGFPPLIAYLTPNPTSTPTPLLSPSSTAFITPNSLVSPTSTTFLEPTVTEIVTSAPISTAITPTSSQSIMYVSLAANRTTGRSPLTVKFDARKSYVLAPDGEIFECENGACRYSWNIYLNGQITKSDISKNGTFEYRFQAKGTYIITVEICHGASDPTCGLGSTFVIVD